MDKINILKRKFIPATCSHESELLHCVVTPPIDSAWSSYLTGFQGQLLEVLPRATFLGSWAFTACKNLSTGSVFVCVLKKKNQSGTIFVDFFFSTAKHASHHADHCATHGTF